MDVGRSHEARTGASADTARLAGARGAEQPPLTAPGLRGRRSAATARRIRRGAAAVAAGAVLSACGSSGSGGKAATATTAGSTVTTAAGTASTDAGTPATTAAAFANGTIFTDAKDHFSVVVPSSWQQIDLTDPAVKDKIAAMLASNPKLTSAIGNTDDLASKGTKYLAIDPSGSGDDANVVVNSASGAPAKPSDKDLEDAYSGLQSGLSDAGGTVVSHRIFTLNGHRTLQILYDLDVQNPDGTSNVLHMRGDVVVTKDMIHTLTLPAAASADPIESSFNII